MFAAENAVRYRALPNMPHAGLLATVQASAAVGVGGFRAPPMNAGELRQPTGPPGCKLLSPERNLGLHLCKLQTEVRSLLFGPAGRRLDSPGHADSGPGLRARGCSRPGSWPPGNPYPEGVWHSACPAPASIEGYRGVDRNVSEIRRARLALGDHAEFVVGDIAAESVSGATLVVLLDVLHYLDFATQIALLRRIRADLPAQGQLLLRVGDSDGSLRARISLWVDPWWWSGCAAGATSR